MADATTTAGQGEDARLDHADKAMTLADGRTEMHHAEPEALGLAPGAWVALSMAVLIAILLYKRVPRAVTGGLDASIAAIRQQLDEAKALRAEAEALRAEYAAKIADAEKAAAAMLDHARDEAQAIVAKAESDTTQLIARREKMANDKIAAAERGAVEDLRRQAVGLASRAARELIGREHGAAADKALVDSEIAGI